MSRSRRVRQELRNLNISTSVPVPEIAESSPRGRWAPRWVTFAFPLLVIGLALAAVRGDQPTTVTVDGGTVTPVSDLDSEVFADSGTYAVIDPTAGDHLEVCAWDYCIVHDQMGDARIEQFTYTINLEEATAIAQSVTTDLGLPAVDMRSETLGGNLGGFYDPATGSITLDQPIVAWTVIHELAHHIVFERHGPAALSHGERFLETLDQLAGGG